MKVSKNWIQEYLGFELPATDVLVEKIGAQLGGVDAVIDLAPMYAGATIVKVIECTKLENSDHLNLCFVDDNGVTADVARTADGLVQVVCGAPNVRAGVFVVWLPPGATVPSSYATDPFVLEARELRGTVSNGMLASAKELAIGDSHDGLLLLDDEFDPGTAFADAYKLNDQIIDIENKMFTHRPDCFGQLGVAREVAGIFGQQFSSPDWYVSREQIMLGDGLQLTVRNEAPAVVPRIMAVALKNVTVAPSPLWLQTQLSRVGLRPINNLVDITNYIMMLTGQPTHAYDYDKVAALSDGDGATLVARLARPAEQVTLLSGKTVTVRDGGIVIATDQQAIGLAGVMGGANTEVDDATKNVILECASFDMYSIRRTSMAHGLFTDAVTRFNKGQSRLQNPSVLAKTVELFQQLAGAEVASGLADVYDQAPAAPRPVEVSAAFINARLGVTLAAADMAQLLTNVEFKIAVADELLTVTAPFWRTDIADPEDIVEEVGRLYGFDALPLELPARVAMPTYQDPLLMQKTAIRDSLVAAGANELLTYSFVHGDLLDKVGQSKDVAFKLTNALSPDLQYLRFHALPSLLDKVHANIKAGYDSFALFELNKGHATDAFDHDLPVEFEMLDLVFVSKQPLDGAAFYHARRYLDALAADLGVELRYQALTGQPTEQTAAAYDAGRSAYVYAGDTRLGIVGEFQRSAARQLKLPAYCAGFSIDQQFLLAARGSRGTSYQPLPKFPKIEQDICLRTASDMPFERIAALVTDTLQAHKPADTLLHVTPLDIYKGDSDQVQTTFRIGLASHLKTMTDQEMSGLLDVVAAQAANDLGAERV